VFPKVLAASVIFIKLPKVNKRRWGENSPYQGPILLSQFSAIFNNFRRTKWRFS
jgi:hypothetical protein